MSAYQGFVFFGSFVILIVMLVSGFTAFRAVSVSLLGILFLSGLSPHTRLISLPKERPASRGLVAGAFAAFVVLTIIVAFLGKNNAASETGFVAKNLAMSLLSNLLIQISAAIFILIVACTCDVSKISKALIGAAKGGMALIVAASCVGIILGVVDLTGLGASLPAQIQGLANDNAILALLLLMVSTIILGMGLPSAVCYLLMAILVGSVLTTLSTPPLAAHLFIFYFGMMSMVTPPVALAAYAAAAIANGDVMRTAFCCVSICPGWVCASLCVCSEAGTADVDGREPACGTVDGCCDGGHHIGRNRWTGGLNCRIHVSPAGIDLARHLAGIEPDRFLHALARCSV